MRAMILAAGLGSRMGELTRELPKPLLRVGNLCLIEHVILNLVRAGFAEIVINISYHAQLIKQALGNGQRYGANIVYSEEKECLETGGGIVKALPLLGSNPFLVVSSDIITDYPLQRLRAQPTGLAHLVLVNNPSYHLKGDFGLKAAKVDFTATPTYTFANLGVYSPDLFKGCEVTHFRLTEVLFPAIRAQQVTGEHFSGQWHNVGTPMELQHAQSLLKTT